MAKEITIGVKNFTVRELTYEEVVNNLMGLDVKASNFKMLELACGLTSEEARSLSMKEGVTLMNAINELNGLGTPTANF